MRIDLCRFRAIAGLLCRADESARQRIIKVNLFRHAYNALRPHEALDERTRAAYLAVEHCDWRAAFGGPAT
jgi:hypothetical protein